ncbi:hypothetical protein EDB19DRAFT_1686455 [Suillus lakei]|nr:hypothetical protein EDB19DRAFT_1758410 [Suillus lakei]KAG1747719.1 hypothetical protein EDB19DRAFT_1686455 [Suillus lakei]
MITVSYFVVPSQNFPHGYASSLAYSYLMLSTSYETLRGGNFVVFNPILDSQPDSPEWMRVTLEDEVRIIGMEETQNSVMYLIGEQSFKIDPRRSIHHTV